MCHYCMIVSRQLPASIVYEDERTMAFLVIKPITPGHVVVIPKQHVESLIELSEEDAGCLINAVKRVDQAIHASDLECKGEYLPSRWRGDGQEVSHIHFHVIPRFTGDQFNLRLDSELIRYRSITELENDAQKIREGFRRIQ